jgi:putative transposase
MGMVEQRCVTKVRLYPTPEQESLMARTAGACRFAYNTGLDLKKQSWESDQLSVSSYGLMAMIPLWKEEFPWLSEVPAVALQQSIRNLDTAYRNFFRACKGEGKSRLPRFKTRNSRASFRLTGSAVRVNGGKLWLVKFGVVSHRDARSLPANVASVTVSRDAAGRWFAAVMPSDTVTPLPETTGTRAVGIDLGVKLSPLPLTGNSSRTLKRSLVTRPA